MKSFKAIHTFQIFIVTMILSVPAFGAESWTIEGLKKGEQLEKARREKAERLEKEKQRLETAKQCPAKYTQEDLATKNRLAVEVKNAREAYERDKLIFEKTEKEKMQAPLDDLIEEASTLWSLSYFGVKHDEVELASDENKNAEYYAFKDLLKLNVKQMIDLAKRSDDLPKRTRTYTYELEKGLFESNEDLEVEVQNYMTIRDMGTSYPNHHHFYVCTNTKIQYPSHLPKILGGDESTYAGPNWTDYARACFVIGHSTDENKVTKIEPRNESPFGASETNYDSRLKNFHPDNFENWNKVKSSVKTAHKNLLDYHPPFSSKEMENMFASKFRLDQALANEESFLKKKQLEAVSEYLNKCEAEDLVSEIEKLTDELEKLISKKNQDERANDSDLIKKINQTQEAVDSLKSKVSDTKARSGK